MSFIYCSSLYSTDMQTHWASLLIWHYKAKCLWIPVNGIVTVWKGVIQCQSYFQNTDTILYQSRPQPTAGTMVSQALHQRGVCSIDFIAIQTPLLRPTVFIRRRTDIVFRAPKTSSSTRLGRTWNGFMWDIRTRIFRIMHIWYSDCHKQL